MRTAIATIERPERKAATFLWWVSRLFLLGGILSLGYTAYFYASAFVFQKTESISFNYPSPPDAPAIRHIIPEGG